MATLLALRDRVAPPTLGWEQPEEGLDLDYVPGAARPLAADGRPIGALELVRVRRPQRALPRCCARMSDARHARRAPAGAPLAARAAGDALRPRLDQLVRSDVARADGRPRARRRRRHRRHRRVDGRPVACFAQDPAFPGGSLGEAHADTIVRVLGSPSARRIPVVGFVESAGARLQEGVAALGRLRADLPRAHALSGVVPQIT